MNKSLGAIQDLTVEPSLGIMGRYTWDRDFTSIHLRRDVKTQVPTPEGRGGGPTKQNAGRSRQPQYGQCISTLVMFTPAFCEDNMAAPSGSEAVR